MGGIRATTGGERAVRATRRNPPRHANYTGGKTSRRISVTMGQVVTGTRGKQNPKWKEKKARQGKIGVVLVPSVREVTAEYANIART